MLAIAILTSDLHALEIRLELSAGAAGDLGADAAEVLFLTTGRDLVAHLGAFSAELASAGHDSTRSVELVVRSVLLAKNVSNQEA